MNDYYYPDDALDDQMRRFYQDVYEPIEPPSQTWKKLVSRLDEASPPRKGMLATLWPSARGSTLPEPLSHNGRMRHRLGAAFAVLVTAIIILASLALFDMTHAPSVGFRTPSTLTTSSVPVTPVATVGPQQKYVYNIVTSNGVNQNYTPADETSHFPAGAFVDVVCYVHGIPSGSKHILSIHWFYDETDLSGNLTNQHVSQTITSNQVVYFALQYPEPGLGMAKVFLDLPTNDNGEQANDPYLAGQIYFAIDPVSPATATPG